MTLAGDRPEHQAAIVVAVGRANALITVHYQPSVFKMKPRPNSSHRHLLAVSLAAASAFFSLAPALADGTAAGTSIKNTATGTFSDGTTTYNTTSNTVTIEVSEIAGIKVVAQPPSNPSPNANDTLYVEFLITNTGNDPTQFFLPKDATLSNPTAFSQNGPIQIVEVNGTPLGTFVDVLGTPGSPNGNTTGNLLGTSTAQGSLLANPGTGTSGTLKVRVPILVSPTATAGSTLKVSLGETNQIDSNSLTQVVGAKDLYTVDNPTNGIGGETNTTAPLNGTLEAMATSAAITVNARLQAFTAVLKAVSSYNNNSTPNVLTDDAIAYKLALRVENPTTPPTGLVTSDLYGTAINVNSSTATPYILVADAVPPGLQISSTAPPTGPANWTPVYTTSALAISAQNATWVTANPGTGVTRVGFVYNTNATTATPAGNGPISKGTAGVGTTVSGFNITMTPTATFTGGSIANIAQVFGQSQPGAVAPNSSTQLVYDESGDQDSNNGLKGTNPDPTTGGASNTTGGITDGVADPIKDGRDPGTGNDPTNTTTTNTGVDTGTGSGTSTLGGEATIFTIAATPLNGPNTLPGATGPTGTNDDFTNKSIVVPAGKAPTILLTDAETTPVIFTNTVQNTSGGTQAISLLPTAPTTATALPDDTKVTLTDPVTGNTALYNYTAATGFTFVSGTGTTATQPLSLTVPSGGNANYTTTIDLPKDVAQLQEFPVSVTAFVDLNNDGKPTNEPSNITIDRLYTNYVSLLKEARILEADGTTEVVPFTTLQASLSPAATPGRILEYRITYKNIATPAAGTSTSLAANSLVISEQGTSALGNNWATTTIDPKYPTNPLGSATDSTTGVIIVTTGGTPSNITAYQDTVPSVPPGSTGTFIFQRQIKDK
jgi:hypothetical protein